MEIINYWKLTPFFTVLIEHFISFNTLFFFNHDFFVFLLQIFLEICLHQQYCPSYKKVLFLSSSRICFTAMLFLNPKKYCKLSIFPWKLRWIFKKSDILSTKGTTSWHCQRQCKIVSTDKWHFSHILESRILYLARYWLVGRIWVIILYWNAWSKLLFEDTRACVNPKRISDSDKSKNSNQWRKPVGGFIFFWFYQFFINRVRWDKC